MAHQHPHNHHDHDGHDHAHHSPKKEIVKPYNITSTTLDNSKVEISAALSWEDLSKYRARALKQLQANVVLPGFRKGHVPEDMLIAHAGEMTLLNHMAEMALEDAYPLLLERELVHPIDFPAITITKMAPDNPLEFKLEIEVYPTITLADYKRIAKKEMLVEERFEVTDKEAEDAYKEILKQVDASEEDGVPKDILERFEVANKEELFKKLKEQLLEEKKRQAKDKKRTKILEEIVKESGMPIPSKFIEEELTSMMMQFKDDIGRMGHSFPDYLSRIKKTEEELRAEWRKDAEHRVKFHLALANIAETEKITPDQEAVAKEVAHMKEHHQNIPEEQLQRFVERILRNEKVFQFLEEQK